MSISTGYTPLGPRMSPKTPRHHHRHAEDAIPSAGFRIGYQRVILDVDLAEQTVHGETELTVLPLEASLRHVKLDCRGIQIRSVIVNQRCAQFAYGDFGQNDEYLNAKENPILADYKYDKYLDSNSPTASISQHHLYRGRHYPLYSDQNNTAQPTASYPVSTSELVIRIPDSIKLHLQSSTAKSFSSPSGQPLSIHGTPLTNPQTNSEKVYTPLNIKILYTVRNSRNGVLFHGGRHTDVPQNQWYCYTYNSSLHCSASSWVPCLDSFYEKPAWDVSIVVPKTVADIGGDASKDAENEPRDDGDEDDQSPPIVVAVPDLVGSKETDHRADPHKKVVNFQFYNPVSAHHLGFAVGPFEKTPLLDLKPGTDKLVPSTTFANLIGNEGSNEEIKMENSNKVPTMFYYLPGQKDKVVNTTVFLYRALDFYSKEFSSFPFTSYTVVFLDDLPDEHCTFAGMTIASEDLLYGPEMIDPIFTTTEKLAVCLAEQYAGVNVVPRCLNDLWCTAGLAGFMALQFLKRLFGLNQYKYMLKKRTDRLCQLDVSQRPLANEYFRFPINMAKDLEFIRYKAPLVLHILDQRMIKTDKSFGLSRVIPKIFLQAMSNDLASGNCLSSAHFQHVCERVAHHKLDQFFQNWVHNAGVPVFHITQKFNKKRMFIEMSIRQVQQTGSLPPETQQDADVEEFRRRHFVDDASGLVSGEPPFTAQNVFTGPVTMRVHEADGTPYEHILFIRDAFTKLGIQYNTKYRRTRKKKEGVWEEDNEKETLRDERSFGDVLVTASEAENWGLKDDPQDDPALVDTQTHGFEWMRFDADGEWLCARQINVTDQMEESKLCQDRDVEAQLEAVAHFSDDIGFRYHHAIVLLRTLVDKRYHYGVRSDAALGLAKISSEDNDHIGMRYLLRAFKHLYCYGGTITRDYDEFSPKEYMPVSNDFSDFADYFVLKAIVKALAQITNKDGDTPIELKRILLSILRYNDNMDNEFDDCFFVCDILRSLSTLIVHSGKPVADHNVTVLSEQPQHDFSSEVLLEMNRAVKMDTFAPSFHDCVEVTVLREKVRLAFAGLINLTFEELLVQTAPSRHRDLRLAAFEGLLVLGGLRNSAILELFFLTLKLDPSQYVRYHLVQALEKAVGVAALSGTPSTLDDEEFETVVEESQPVSSKPANGGGMVIVEDNSSSSLMKSRQDVLAKKTLRGAIELLRRDYSVGRGLQHGFWDAVHSSLLSTSMKRDVLDLAAIIFQATDTFVVKTILPTDKKIVAVVDERAVRVPEKVPEKVEGPPPPPLSPPNKFVVKFRREGRLVIQLPVVKLKPHVAGSRTSLRLRAVSVSKEKDKPVLKVKRELVAPAAHVPPPKLVRLPHPALPPPPPPSRVRVHSGHGKFAVSFRFKPGTVLPGAPKIARSEVIKTSAILPIRYVKIYTKEKRIWLSDSETFGGRHVVRPVKPTKIVTLRVPSEKLTRFQH